MNNSPLVDTFQIAQHIQWEGIQSWLANTTEAMKQ